MKVSITYMLILFVFTCSFAQESQQSPESKDSQTQPVVKEVGKVQGQGDKVIKERKMQDAEKPDAPHVIDFNKAPHKVEPKRVTNTLSGKDKVREPMGPADASAPRQKLEKKQEQTSVKKSELLEKLKDPKPIKRKDVE